MKFEKIIFCLFIVIMVLACEDASKNPVGNWEMFDMEGITGLDQSVNAVTSDESWDSYIREYGNQQIKEEYKNLSSEEKEKARSIVKKEIRRRGKGLYKEFTQDAFVSLKNDSTFAFYFYPYYLNGRYAIAKDTIVGEILEIASILKWEKNVDEYAKTFKLRFEKFEENNIFIIDSEKFPSIWGLDTLYVKKTKNQYTARSAAQNRWRLKGESSEKRLKEHLKYLIHVFEDAMANEKSSLGINNQYHCSPFKFYGNGIAIKENDSEDIVCWKGLFESEEHFLESQELLSHAFRRSSMKKDENRFKRNIAFLNQVLHEL